MNMKNPGENGMNDQTNANVLHSQAVRLRMQGKSTEELLSIWQENDTNKWSREDFDAIQKILMERIGKLPEQNKLERGNEQIKPAGQNASSNSVSGKYPYLTAYVGFVALFLLFGLVLGLIPFLSEFGFILQVIGGFYIFKFVIEKNVLPHVQKK